MKYQEFVVSTSKKSLYHVSYKGDSSPVVTLMKKYSSLERKQIFLNIVPVIYT
jgi:hypothetical protein